MPLETAHFWKRIEEAFETRNVAEMAEKVGLKVQALYKWQKGTIPSLDTLVKISDLTGSSIHWLVTGEGPQKVEAITDLKERQIYVDERLSPQRKSELHGEIRQLLEIMKAMFSATKEDREHAEFLLADMERRFSEHETIPVVDQLRAPDKPKRTGEGKIDEEHERTAHNQPTRSRTR